MKLFRRPQRTPVVAPDAAAIAAALAAETNALIERERLLSKVRREDEEAARETAKAEAREQAEAEERRKKEEAERRAKRVAQLQKIGHLARTAGPLLLSNAASIGGQIGYVYGEAPEDWPAPVKVAVAIGVAAAAESISLYIGWQAHEHLLRKAHSTAAKLRRASYGVALLFGAVNYSHFSDGWQPTAMAVILGTLSVSSPWLWGLYSRWKQHIQLVAEGLIDEAGVEFSPARRRAFPLRTWAAKRWSIEHNERDPRKAWEGYNKERQRRTQALDGGRLRVAGRVLRRGSAALPAAPASGELDDATRAALEEIKAEAKRARYRLAMGAHAFYQSPTVGIVAAKPVATCAAIDGTPQVAIASAAAGHLDGQLSGHDGGQDRGQDDVDLLAIVTATQDAPTVASKVAMSMATEGGHESGGGVAIAVASRTGRQVAMGGREGDIKQRDAQIKRLAKKNTPDAEIAAQVNVSISTVRRVLGKKK
ncbi:hypothetical protein GCM10027280_45120 [Micromonospora polyrhachis]|uniref:Uncharacterized protein n=1 Tax=Micromonospora polyrhachis TaxID=1282883 RepID=A0A7W7SQA8_9ACTN|nr:hypothetical protein [Micromonospora polyrhachis]MBB4958974.1 hypothetical protein [Micromonospora polyrhachis]